MGVILDEGCEHGIGLGRLSPYDRSNRAGNFLGKGVQDRESIPVAILQIESDESIAIDEVVIYVSMLMNEERLFMLLSLFVSLAHGCSES